VPGIGENSRRSIVPINAVTFQRQEKRNCDFHIDLRQQQSLAALVHPACLMLSETVNRFVITEPERLPDTAGPLSRVTFRRECRTVFFLRQQQFPFRGQKTDATAFALNFQMQNTPLQEPAVFFFFLCEPARFRLHHHRKAPFFHGAPNGIFQNVDDFRREELNFDFQSVGRDTK